MLAYKISAEIKSSKNMQVVSINFCLENSKRQKETKFYLSLWHRMLHIIYILDNFHIKAFKYLLLLIIFLFSILMNHAKNKYAGKELAEI